MLAVCAPRKYGCRCWLAGSLKIGFEKRCALTDLNYLFMVFEFDNENIVFLDSVCYWKAGICMDVSIVIFKLFNCNVIVRVRVTISQFLHSAPRHCNDFTPDVRHNKSAKTFSKIISTIIPTNLVGLIRWVACMRRFICWFGHDPEVINLKLQAKG